MNKFTKKALVFIVLLLISINSIPNQASAAAYSSLFLSSQPAVSDPEKFEFSLLSPNAVFQIGAWINKSKESPKEPVQPTAVASAVAKSNAPARKTHVVSATAYSSTPDQTDDTPFITAMGTHVRDGIIATNMLPFGTRVRIPSVFGNKVFIVEDRMNKRYWDRIDVWFPDRESAIQFGLKRSLIIEVL